MSKLFHFTNAEISELSFLEIVNNKWQTKTLFDKLSRSLPLEEEFYLQHHFNGIGMLKLQVSIERISTQLQAAYILIIKFEEATNEKAACSNKRTDI